jgi:Flp pilus assembly protein TadB
MRRAIERDTPPEPRPWNTMGRAERVAALMIIVVLVACLAVVGVLMAARGYGLVVAVFIVAFVAVMAYAVVARRRRWGGDS